MRAARRVDLSPTLAKLIIALLLVSTIAHADDGDRWNSGTMELQIAGALGGMAVGSVVGGFAGAFSRPGGRGTADVIVLAACVGAVVGEVYGVDQVGAWRGSTGHWYGTTLGLLGGIGVALAVHSLGDRVGLPRTLQIVLAAPLAITGSVIGYQLSADRSARAIAIPLIGVAF